MVYLNFYTRAFCLQTYNGTRTNIKETNIIGQCQSDKGQSKTNVIEDKHQSGTKVREILFLSNSDVLLKYMLILLICWMKTVFKKKFGRQGHNFIKFLIF